MAALTGRGSLQVEADLHVVLDGHPAHLIGSGTELQLRSQSPAALWSAVTGAALPSGFGRLNGARAIGRVADQLKDQGLTFSVVGPTGELVRLGSGTSSRIGRVATGSSAVHLGSVRVLTPTVLTVVRQAGANLLARFARLRRR